MRMTMSANDGARAGMLAAAGAAILYGAAYPATAVALRSGIAGASGVVTGLVVTRMAVGRDVAAVGSAEPDDVMRRVDQG